MFFCFIQIAVSMMAYYHYYKNRIRYFTVITAIYFLSYFVAGSYDVPLTVYFIMVVLGIGIPRNIQLFEWIIYISLTVYSVIGILFQDVFLTLSSLITRYGYILIYFLLFSAKWSKRCWRIKKSDFHFMVRWGLLTEFLIVGLVWIQDGLGSRIVTNHQPIGAGIVIGLAVIIGWCYYTKRFSSSEMLIYSLITVVIVIMSGTRGYMVMIALPLLIILMMYLLDIHGNGEKQPGRMGVFLILVIVAVVFIWIMGMGEEVIQLLRLDKGLGYRENENAFVKGIMKNAPWYHQLFGFGLGGGASHIDGFLNIVEEASWNRSFMYDRLLTGTIFHNYWYTILFKQGIIGLIMVIAFFGKMIKDVYQLKTDLWISAMLYTMILGSAVSLTFRVTATCSIYETMMIAVLMNIIRRSTKRENKGEKKR